MLHPLTSKPKAAKIVHPMHVTRTEAINQMLGIDKKKNEGARTEKIASSVTTTRCNQIKPPFLFPSVVVSLAQTAKSTESRVVPAPIPKRKANVSAV